MLANSSESLPEIALAQPCGYQIDGNRISINVASVANNRGWENLSGTLSVELWALRQAYTSEQFDGVALAGTCIGEIHGQHFVGPCHYDLLFVEPPVGCWHLCLMVREYTGSGYVTRDAINFDLPYISSWKPAVIPGGAKVISVDFANDPLDAPVAETTQSEAVLAEKHRASADASVTAKDELKTKPSTAPSAKAKPTESNTKISEKTGKSVEAIAKEKEVAKEKSVQVEEKKTVANPEVAAKSIKSSTTVSKAAVAEEKQVSLKENSKLSINDCSLKDLEQIKGVSKKVAQNILNARPVKSFDELLTVKGLGKRLLDKIKTEVSL